MIDRGRVAASLALCLALVAGAPADDGHSCTVVVSPGAELQQAIGRMPAEGVPTLCLGAGEFRLRRFVSIARDNLILRGEGPATVLQLEAGRESPVIVVGDYTHANPTRVTSNVTIEKLRIVGGGSEGREFEPEHPWMMNSAVVVRAGRKIVIRGLDVTACRSACILTERGTHEVSIENNRISDSVWDGISLNRTAQARLVRNAIRGNRAAGITTEHLENSLVEDNEVSENRTHGLYLSDSSGNTVARNRFRSNVLSGVFLTCAVRDHAPAVRCWDDSMSRDNVFERNDFVGNRVGFMVVADAAANCRAPGFVPNLSRGDRFLHDRNEEPDWVTYGRCLRYAEPRSG
jgi:parallel beta-helix repeat protein